MGLARVVRSMEILGHALVDMREAPDAQVVLEIATVRAVRPDLDSGMEALSERVSVLERSFSGAPAFPRPGPAAPARAAQAPPAVAPPSESPEPAAPPPAAEVGRRPSIGAVRRSQKAAAEAVASSAAETSGATVPDEPVAESSGPSRPAPTAPAVPGRAASPGPGRAIDRDSLTEAWGDGILKALPARAKALYSAGRFVAVDDQGAHFALPNAAHRDRCADLTPTVEAALGAHFGAPVTLVLDIDDADPPAPATGGPAPAAGAADAPGAEEEVVDPAEFATDDAGGAGGAAEGETSAAEARLLEAFPGASEVLG